MQKALIIACSPRKKGNSDIMAETTLKKLVEEDYQAEIIYLRELNFSMCNACNGCSKDGSCVVNDDMQLMYSKLLEASIIIFSAPVYFQSLSALAKAFIDRCQCFWATKYVLKQNLIKDELKRASRKTYALLCGGTDFPDTFTCSEKIIRIFALVAQAKYVGSSTFPLIDEKGDILKSNHLERLKSELTEALF